MKSSARQRQVKSSQDGQDSRRVFQRIVRKWLNFEVNFCNKSYSFNPFKNGYVGYRYILLHVRYKSDCRAGVSLSLLKAVINFRSEWPWKPVVKKPRVISVESVYILARYANIYTFFTISVDFQMSSVSIEYLWSMFVLNRTSLAIFCLQKSVSQRPGSIKEGSIILLKTHSHMPVETKLKDSNTDVTV